MRTNVKQREVERHARPAGCYGVFSVRGDGDAARAVFVVPEVVSVEVELAGQHVAPHVTTTTALHMDYNTHRQHVGDLCQRRRNSDTMTHLNKQTISIKSALWISVA